MPDWMSHILIGLILAEVFCVRRKSLVVLGSLIPDFLSKFHLPSFYFGITEWLSFSSFHTPAMAFLTIVLLAGLFNYNQTKAVGLMTLGAMSHILADATLKHFNSGQYLFFPFSFKVYALNWLWPDETIFVLPFLALVYSLVKLAKRILSKDKAEVTSSGRGTGI